MKHNVVLEEDNYSIKCSENWQLQYLSKN